MTRYASGEEPMVGDMFTRRGDERWSLLTKESLQVELEDADPGAPVFGDCTLIRRGELLGHDRNGREVRRGDRVQHYSNTEHPITVDAARGGFFVSPDNPRSVRCAEAELVTDEKAERCNRRYADIPCDGNHVNGRHGFNDRNAIGGRWEWWDTDVGDAVQSFARWLAEPTLVDLYEDLKRKVAAMAFKFSVFDIETGLDFTDSGAMVRLRVGQHRTTLHHTAAPLRWEAVEEFFSAAVASEADRIGREALKLPQKGAR